MSARPHRLSPAPSHSHGRRCESERLDPNLEPGRAARAAHRHALAANRVPAPLRASITALGASVPRTRLPSDWTSSPSRKIAAQHQAVARTTRTRIPIDSSALSTRGRGSDAGGHRLG